MTETLVVVDSNVLVGALCSARGQNREVLRLCLLGQCQPVIGTSLFLEYEDVMGRDEVFTRCPVTRADRMKLFRAFLKVCRWTSVYYLWRPNLGDEGDNHVFELAVAAGAEAIITNNVKDLRSGELKFPDVQVLKPTEFVKRMN